MGTLFKRTPKCKASGTPLLQMHRNIAAYSDLACKWSFSHIRGNVAAGFPRYCCTLIWMLSKPLFSSGRLYCCNITATSRLYILLRYYGNIAVIFQTFIQLRSMRSKCGTWFPRHCRTQIWIALQAYTYICTCIYMQLHQNILLLVIVHEINVNMFVYILRKYRCSIKNWVYLSILQNDAWEGVGGCQLIQHSLRCGYLVSDVCLGQLFVSW